jgi:hypothetical protein
VNSDSWKIKMPPQLLLVDASIYDVQASVWG